MKVKAVSFATPGAYAEYAQRLIASAEEHCIPIEAASVEFPESVDVWRAAVCHKPTFIAERLSNLEPQYDGLLWTDADSVFRRAPDWSVFDGVDFACHVFNRSRHHDPEMLAGTMYFGRESHVRLFVKDWIVATKRHRHSDTPEQRGLADALAAWTKTPLLRAKELGPEWCWIFDDSPEIYGHRTVIVEHFQASRRLKTR